jgi:4-azaleucine resistance transporter AzlC
MGAAFGILLAGNGFNPIWAFIMAVIIYTGSGQFVAVGLLASGFDPFNAFLVTLMVNARHVFYGISMLERFKNYGKSKYYMIFALTDETFALHCSAKPLAGMNEEKFYLAISIMDHIYWIAGCTLGGIIGSALPTNTTGIDFVMTALFVVIFLDQWKLKQNRAPALIGLGTAIVCRMVFVPDWFILTCMASLVVIFSVFKKPIERELGKLNEHS